MKFDFVIGNPPYQEEYNGSSTGKNSVYHLFMDAAYQISDKVELITPARFLFNAGSTPKEWNRKMLSDKHFKVLAYYVDSNDIFPNQDINGGIAITFHDNTNQYQPIGTFTQFDELNSILKKVQNSDNFNGLSQIMVTSFAYHFTKTLYEDYPEFKGRLSAGHQFDFKSNVFDKLTEIFYETKPNDKENYIKILGRSNSQRTTRYINKKYVNDVVNLYGYKVFLAKADGAAGTVGNPIPARIVGQTVMGEKGTGSTESFLSIGNFDTEIEMINTAKYIKTKFARALLGVLKITQDITPDKWRYVPIQSFTSASDIDWSKSIAEIDQQLYKKYGLTDEEIDFIETHVKEME